MTEDRSRDRRSTHTHARASGTDPALDALRKRSFYPRPHERNKTVFKRIKNWIRARIGGGGAAPLT